TVDVTFQVSKSWARVDWRADLPVNKDAYLGADLNLNVRGEPVLVDFGAESTVYTSLKKGQSAALRSRCLGGAGPGIQILYEWSVVQLSGGSETALARSLPQKADFRIHKFAEGWAHVMDRQRCTAVVPEWSTDDKEIAVSADGRVRLSRLAM